MEAGWSMVACQSGRGIVAWIQMDEVEGELAKPLICTCQVDVPGEAYSRVSIAAFSWLSAALLALRMAPRSRCQRLRVTLMTTGRARLSESEVCVRPPRRASFVSR